ncbi:MAG: beta-galactosidase, partial [Anaerolineae bacterium]
KREGNDLIAFSADLMRSATLHEDGLFWIIELQCGTSLYTLYRYFCPSTDDIRQWMWQSIGSGAEGIVFWCFNTRDHGVEGAEFGLLNHAGKPSQRLLAVSDVAASLDRHEDIFAISKPPEPDVWIYYSEATCTLGFHEDSFWGSLLLDKPKMEDT